MRFCRSRIISLFIFLLLGGSVRAATFTWTGSVSADWFNTNNWSPAGLPATNDIINFNSGNITLTNPVTIGGQFNWAGGNLAGSPLTIATNGALNLIGGSSVALYAPLTNFGTINWSNSVTFYVYNNPGAGWYGAMWNQAGGLFNIESDQTMYNQGGGAFFINAGTVSKGANTGATGFNLPFTNNAASGVVTALKGAIYFNGGAEIDGAFNAASGAFINFNSGSFTYASVPTVNASGTVQLTGGSLTLASNTIPNLQLNGGTLTLGTNFQGGTITNLSFFGGTLTGTNILSGLLNNSSTLNGPLTLQNGSTMNWSGGNANAPIMVAGGATLNWSAGNSSTITVQPSGVMNILGGGSVALYGALTNFGTVNWSNSVTFYVYGNPGNNWSGAVWNQPGGLFNIECDQSIYNQGGSAFFYNAGTVSKGANTGNTGFNLPFTNNVSSGVVTALKGSIYFSAGGDMVGIFNASAGAAINFSGGTLVYDTVPILNGPGTFNFSGGNLTLLSNNIPNLQLVGGTLTLGTNFQGGTITNLTFSGGTLTGTNVVSGTFNNGSTVAGPLSLLSGATMNWTGGDVQSPLTVNGGATLNWSGGNASPITVQTNGVMNLLGGSSVALFGALTNYGTLNWSNSVTFYVYSNPGNNWFGSVWNESGATFNIQSDQGIYNLGGSAFFNNAGLISKGANTGGTSFNIPFTNSVSSGAVTALKGAIYFNGGGDINGTFNAATNSAINFNGGTFVYETVPTLNGPGTINFTAGTLTLVNDIIPNLQLNGGTLILGTNFQGGVITNLVFGGTLNGNYTVGIGGTLTLGNGESGTLTLSSNATVNWSGGTITSGIIMATNSTINWSGGSLNAPLNIVNGATLNWSGGNASPITVQTNGVMNLLGGSSVALFGALTNYGTLNWSNSVTFYVYSNPGNNWFGSVWNEPGALFNIESDQGMYNQGGSAFLNNAGLISKGANTGGTSFNLPFTNSVTSGVVTALKGAIYFNGGGDINGTFNAATNAAINFNGGTFVYDTVPTLSGPGSINFTAGTLTLVNDIIPNLQLNGGTLNLGTNFQGGVITNLVYGGTLNGNYLVNGTLTLGNGVVGSIALTNNATLNWTGGTITAGISMATNSTLNWSGGSLNAPLEVVNGATVNWSGGNASPITVESNASLNFSGNSSVALYGALTNYGIINWNNSVTIYVYNNPGNGWFGTIWNEPGALFNIACDQGMYNQGGGAYLNNAGTVTKNANTGTTTFSLPFTNNATSGVVVDSKGAINFNGGGDINGTFNAATNTAINFNGGTFVYDTVPTFNGPGAINFTGGSLTLVSNTIPNLQLVGGTLFLGSNFQGGSISNLIFGGVLNGDHTVSAGGTLTLGNGDSGSLTVASNATLNWSGGTITGGITLTNGSIMNWSGGSFNGVLNIGSGATVNWSAGNASPITIQSNGVLNLIGGSSIAVYGALTNYGTLNWSNSITFYVYNNAGNGWFGSVWNEPGALFNLASDQGMYNQGGGAFFNNAGTISKAVNTGVTSINMPFTNSAALNVQSGTINFNSGLAETTGAFSFGINGAGNYGHIGISGNAPIVGSLNVSLNNGYVPALSNSFALISYGSESGAFFSTNLPTQGVFWQANYGSTVFNLVVTNYVAPVVAITSPSSNAVFAIPANIAINATATDANVPITKVEFFQGTNKVGESLTSPYNFTWNNVPFGTYVLTAKATDAAGAITVSSPINISVYLNASGTNYMWNGSSSSDWFNPANWTPAGVPGVFDTATITNNGSVNLTNNAAIASLNVNSGTVSGAGLLTVTNAFLWSGGSMRCPLLLTSGATMDLIGGTMDLQNVLTNAGTVNWLSGDLQFGACSGGPVVNLASGIWNIKCDRAFNGTCNGTNDYFQNLGVVQKLAGVNTTTFSLPFRNAGSVLAATGTINFHDGGVIENSFTAASGAAIIYSTGNFTNALPTTLNGPGSIQFNGDSLTLLSNTIANLPLTAGTIYLGSNFQGGTITNLTLAGATLAGSNTVTGILNWTGGTINNALVLTTNAVLNITGAATKNFSGALLKNSGTVSWTGGTIQTGGTSITNLGAWSIQTDSPLNNALGGNPVFANSGIVRKITATGVTTISGVAVFNSGIFDLQSGTITLSQSSSYAQTGATLGFTISSPISFSQLNLAGAVNLDGTLIVNFLNGYTPALSNSFKVLTYGNGLGNFANLQLPNLPPGKSWEVNYGISSVALRVASAGTNNNLVISGSVKDTLGNAVSNGIVYASYAQSSVMNLVQNGNFEAPNIGNNSYVIYGVGATNIPGWTIIGPANANVDVTGSPFSPAQDGNQYFDPTGNTGGAGITQVVPTIPGTAYELIFYHGTYNQHGIVAALGVTLGTNSYTFGETAGLPGSLNWTEEQIQFVAVSNATTLTFQEITGFNSDDNFVDNVQVVPVDFGKVFEAVTDNSGNYQIPVASATWLVGVDGLVALGYNPISAQTVVINGSSQVVNFVVQPNSSAQNFSIAASVSPAGSGTASGGGTYASGATVNLTAVAITNIQPFFFVNWTENGVPQSTNSSYLFTADRNRQLVANFTLPQYTISASNNPTGGGSISGTGVFTYGVTNVLTATANFGYTFSNWTEGATVVGTSTSLTNVVTAGHSFAANYAAVNLSHVVTTATTPPALAVVGGAGTYSNGQTANFTTPLSITNIPYVYTFKGYTLSNSLVSSATNYSKTFSTLDQPNLLYVAVYQTTSIQPVITQVSANFSSPIPATTNFLLTLQFDRAMQTNVAPLIVLTNANATAQPVIATNGTWSTTAYVNDTYHAPPIVLSAGMDGVSQLLVSQATDSIGDVLSVTNPTSFTVDVTPPPVPTLVATATNSSTISVGWSSYAAPGDLSSFRVYLQSNNFTSVAGLPILTGLGGATRSYQFGNLSLDTPYYVALQALDVAGNASAVSPLSIIIPSTIPPAVTVAETPVGATSANLSWNSYNTSGLLGFAGFNVYVQQNNFTSVAGLTPVVSLAANVTSFQANGLDRTKTNYFAVVGFNEVNGFNPNVTTAKWSDPYAGLIGVNTTIGSASPSVVNIYQNITVVSNATLTILPGTTLLFAPGTSLTVQLGTLAANGTALSPIILDSAKDTSGNTPAAGDWGGVTLTSGASSSSLQFVEILYGGGLTVSGCAPSVNAYTGNFNTPYAIGLQNGATLTTSSALLTGNAVGARQLDSSSLTIQNSVLLNNGTNVFGGGSTPLIATSNWWGTTVQSGVTTTLQGNVTYIPFLTYEPVLTPAIGTIDGATQVYIQSATLELACRTAVSMRISEDNTFNGVFFTPFTNTAVLPLSIGGGFKHIFAQFKSVTGQTNLPVELDLNYVITGGPVIQSFNLAEGQNINRPLTVTGSATASLGLLDMEFYVDGVLQGTNAGTNLSQFFDVRTLGNAVHQVELLARDTAGRIATLMNNVVIAVTPPIAPVITQPAVDIITNVSSVTISGTAEPGIKIQISDNGQILLNTNADSSGNFTLLNAPMVEGVNSILAVASDSTGSTASAARRVSVATIPPAALVLNTPVYQPGTGLLLNWQFAATGKQATTFQLFWSTSSFTSTNQATSHSLVLSTMSYTLQGLNDGTYYFAVIGYDAAGNPSPLSAIISTVYDSTPPVLSIAYSQPSPVGVGALNVVLTSSEVLAAAPSLTIQPRGATSPILLNLTNAALNTYQGTFTVTSATPSGLAIITASAKDLAGNVFNGAPNGLALVIDTTPPTSAIATVPLGPVQTTNSTNVQVNLTLSKLAGTGTTPTLSFAPPIGASVPIILAGGGSNWIGTLPLTSAMGSGLGTFAMSATDGVGNVGSQILSGRQLELYNTALPTAPAAPTNLVAVSLPGGQVRLTWNAVTNAQIYRLYREPGTNFSLPGVLDLDNITGNTVVDLPSVDGTNTYGITASRLGSESGISNTVSAVSDRVPPLAPTNASVALAASGVSVTWQEPTGGEAVDHYNIYRNGALIQRVASVTPVIDFPPTGTDNYRVGAVDIVGNENLSAQASIQLLVGPVQNLSVLVEVGQAVVLNWVDNDVGAVGYNVYRNGIKQNATLLTNKTYTDQLPLSDTVQYAVTAVNNSPAESPPRLVSVSPVNFSLLTNPKGGTTNNALLTGYFDQFQVGITNLASTAPLALTQLQMNRTVNGLSPLMQTQNLTTNLAAGTNMQLSVIFPEASVVATQTMQVNAYQQTDSQGSTVVYQDTFNITSVQMPATEIAVSVNQLPLAGGLTPFQVQIYNRGYADMQLIVSRGGGANPGDLYISVENALGQEVSRTTFQGTPPGTIFLPSGDAYVNIAAGSSLTCTVPNVLSPAALAGSTNITFTAVASSIYNRLGSTNQLVSGPLSGSMVSSGLAQTPYYGTAHTDHPAYDNQQPIIISGQALNQLTGLPVTNAALNIGFATRGYKWYQPVTTDTNGNYQFTYNPSAGFGGSLTIWAAHPLVVDQLNQVQITIYRLYSNPASGDITMSKNGTLNFSIQLINPGDTPLTGVSLSFNATQASGTNQVPVTTITGTNLSGDGFVLEPNQKQTINLQLAATATAPNTAQGNFTFTSTEGASITFVGTINLLPAVPVLTVPSPAVGYLEMSVNRGDQRSGQITLMNSGLQALQGITITPPTNSWILLNLPASGDGKIHLPDLGIGQSNSFTVVFNPPANEPLDFYPDSIIVQGTNVATPFPVNVYALVTSHLNGAVQFNVSDILGDQISKASIRLQNNLIQANVGPYYTDTNGILTVSNLQEGSWSWQINAPGCSSASGAITVIADQTVSVSQILSRSLVSINFTVVPVPFTDVYTVQIEQTFETFVPVPVLTLSPVSQTFNNVTPGFQASFIATAQNQGLIQMENLTINGSQDNVSTLTPLITYAPVLLPQQTIDVPFTISYMGTNAPVHQDDLPPSLACLPGGGVPDDLTHFFEGLNAIASAEGRCYKSQEALVIAGTLAVLLEARQAVSDILGVFTNFPAALGNYLGCLINKLFGLGPTGIAAYNPIFDTTPKTNPNIVNTGESGCFTADTMVLMADGKLKAISEIRTNDLVRSGLRPENVALVRDFYALESATVHRIQIADANGLALPGIEATEEHLFWVDGRGWVAAGNLKSGDWLFNSHGKRVRVSGTQSLKGSLKVYTMRLFGDDAFYANDVMVHDMCGPGSPSNPLNRVEAVK